MELPDTKKLSTFILTSAQDTGREDTIEEGDVAALIARHDTNRDMALSKDEFVAGATQLGFSWVGRTLAARYLYRSDFTGRDGKINCAEGMTLLRLNARDLDTWYGVKVNGRK